MTFQAQRAGSKLWKGAVIGRRRLPVASRTSEPLCEVARHVCKTSLRDSSVALSTRPPRAKVSRHERWPWCCRASASRCCQRVHVATKKALAHPPKPANEHTRHLEQASPVHNAQGALKKSLPARLGEPLWKPARSNLGALRAAGD
eukprot:3681894-Amphidinium_carterae.2